MSNDSVRRVNGLNRRAMHRVAASKYFVKRDIDARAGKVVEPDRSGVTPHEYDDRGFLFLAHLNESCNWARSWTYADISRSTFCVYAR